MAALTGKTAVVIERGTQLTTPTQTQQRQTYETWLSGLPSRSGCLPSQRQHSQQPSKRSPQRNSYSLWAHLSRRSPRPPYS